MDFLDKIVSIVPNAAQKRIEEMGFYAFIHFGMNTFTGKEWGDGTASVSQFTLKNADTDQWCQVIKDAGMKGVILTAKHHDGFCLWDTKTTDYNIMNSPYGKDLLAELRVSADKIGIELGVYISPWDRNNATYATPAYDDFYMQQLEEILDNYGDLFSLWFDGACGSHLDGKPSQVYDFDRYFSFIRSKQPNCAMSICGPDVRWVGNESGVSRKVEYNVVPAFNQDTDKIAEGSQQTDAVAFDKIESTTDDLGSREVLSKYEDLVWYPAEVDVSIRPGWFYHKSQDGMVKKVDKLLKIYLGSVGGNGMFLLNLPPNREGKLAAPDVAVLAELGDRVESMFKTPMIVTKAEGNIEISTHVAKGIAVEPVDSKQECYTVHFNKADIDKVVLIEDIDFSQRVEKFELSTMINGNKQVLFKGDVIGHKKIAMFKIANTDNLTFTILECRRESHIKTFEVYATDYKVIKKGPFEDIIAYFHKKGTAAWIKRNNKKKAKVAKKLKENN